MEWNHGGDLYGYPVGTLDFSANINPLGLPNRVKEALTATMELWDRYPDPKCRALTKVMSAQQGIPPEWIRFGNGAADLIMRVVSALKPKRALLPVPTFSEYQRALEEIQCEISFYFLEERDNFLLTEKFLEEIQPGVDLLILCNPNNPTGQPIERNLLQEILNRCDACGVTLLIDECFLPFVEEGQTLSLKGWLPVAKGLVILGAFTKVYAMAGLRLGYLLCAQQELLDRLDRLGQPWAVSTPAQIAGIAALEDWDYLERTNWVVADGRFYLNQKLTELGMKVIGSKANYIFFKCQNCGDLKEQLLGQGILMRSCGDYPGLDKQFYRVAVRSMEENQRLIQALSKIVKEEP